MPGKAYLALLEECGFREAKVLGPTGVTTSKYTAAFHITARRA